MTGGAEFLSLFSRGNNHTLWSKHFKWRMREKWSFEQWCVLRWLVALNLMEERQWDVALIQDTDQLVFANVAYERHLLRQAGGDIDIAHTGSSQLISIRALRRVVNYMRDTWRSPHGTPHSQFVLRQPTVTDMFYPRTLFGGPHPNLEAALKAMGLTTDEKEPDEQVLQRARQALTDDMVQAADAAAATPGTDPSFVSRSPLHVYFDPPLHSPPLKELPWQRRVGHVWLFLARFDGPPSTRWDDYMWRRAPMPLAFRRNYTGTNQQPPPRPSGTVMKEIRWGPPPPDARDPAGASSQQLWNVTDADTGESTRPMTDRSYDTRSGPWMWHKALSQWVRAICVHFNGRDKLLMAYYLHRQQPPHPVVDKLLQGTNTPFFSAA